MTGPLAPWYAPVTRRLGVIRFGLPTVIAIVLALAPGVAVQAAHSLPADGATLVARAIAAAPPVADTGVALLSQSGGPGGR